MQGDVFGKSGDFTTSPEISQVFGEVSYPKSCFKFLILENKSHYIITCGIY